MKQWRVWTVWVDLAERLVTITASSADEALELCVARGLVSGLGRNPRYVGLHAVEARS